MNQSIDRRIAALEAVSGSTNFVLVVRRIVSPGEVPGETACTTALGMRFARKPTETEDDFIDRVCNHAEATCPAGQGAVRAFLDHEFASTTSSSSRRSWVMATRPTMISGRPPRRPTQLRPLGRVRATWPATA